MSYSFLCRTIKPIFIKKSHSVINGVYTRQTSSNAVEYTNKRKFPYIKCLTIAAGGSITLSFVYQVYKWTMQTPICPNFRPNQNISIHNVLACTALVRNLDQPCSGTNSMRKIGAATGVNFKLIPTRSEGITSSSQIILNDKDITQRNIFDSMYMPEYVETLADLCVKLNEIQFTRLLSNQIGYYIFVCPECHSSVTRQMISSTSYLEQARLQRNAVDISEITSGKDHSP